jgi:hypothetical protein
MIQRGPTTTGKNKGVSRERKEFTIEQRIDTLSCRTHSRMQARTCRWKKPKLLNSFATTIGTGSFRSDPVRTMAIPTIFMPFCRVVSFACLLGCFFSCICVCVVKRSRGEREGRLVVPRRKEQCLFLFNAEETTSLTRSQRPGHKVAGLLDAPAESTSGCFMGVCFDHEHKVPH